MKDAETPDPTIRGALAAWLNVTKTLEPDSGFDPVEARRRAGNLLQLVLHGGVRPADVELSEDFKDVLSALVVTLREFEPLDQRCPAADAVYQFISRISWPERQAAEKRDLLYECAEVGCLSASSVLFGAIRKSPVSGRRSEATGSASKVSDGSAITRSSETARVLRGMAIKGWAAVGLSEEMIAQARQIRIYEDNPDVLSRSRELLDGLVDQCVVADVDVSLLFSACALLRQEKDDDPRGAAKKASSLYAWLVTRAPVVGKLDEHQCLCFLAALWAGSACRTLGLFAESGEWFDVSEIHLNAVVDSAQQAVRLSAARGTLFYQQSDYRRALDLLVGIEPLARQLRMPLEASRAAVSFAATLYAAGRWQQAISLLRRLEAELETLPRDEVLEANVKIWLSGCLVMKGELDEAERLCLHAVRMFAGRVHPMRPLAKWGLGDCYRARGELRQAYEMYRSALEDDIELGLTSLAAQARLTIADTALLLGRDREAEQEILAALPTIEEQKMVPEGLAAVALLKESIRRRKTDPNALRELREHLQARK